MLNIENVMQYNQENVFCECILSIMSKSVHIWALKNISVCHPF